VHTLWTPIASEFDDYIAHPKPNGYQSLHTAVIGPEDKHFEVQIRTYQMHDLAELGVAAHWKYKEGATAVKASHERKIEWLREILAWHRDLTKSTLDVADCLEDRVYVFTPMGQIIDLPVGSTPLDFAYHIHSDVGHRFRGAKVNGHIVNLSYLLQMGDQIEILTGKKPQPSRDWLNVHLGYLKSPRARAKVLLWFREQDEPQMDPVLPKILDGRAKIVPPKITKTRDASAPISAPTTFDIEGVDHLLTRVAQCCKPSHQDPIIGYVTIGRGISIHHQACPNLAKKNSEQANRFLQVRWGK